MIQGNTQMPMKLDLFNILTKIIYSIKFISYKNMIIQTQTYKLYQAKISKTKNIPAQTI